MTQDALTRFALFDLKYPRCRCLAPKSSHQSFCYRCYNKLPPLTRRELYQHIGQGYEHAYVKVLVFLVSAGEIERPDWLNDAQNLTDG